MSFLNSQNVAGDFYPLSFTHFRVYTLVEECEQSLLATPFGVQIDPFQDLLKQGFTTDFLAAILGKMGALWGGVSDSDKSLFQDITCTLLWVISRLKRVHDWTDVLSILDYVSRVHFRKPVISFLFKFMFDSPLEAQSMDWSVLKDLLSSYDALKHHPAVTKFVKVVSLAFSGGILAAFGIEADMAQLWEVVCNSAQKIIGHTDFFTALIDLIYFLGERISAFCITGNWKSLIHTPTSYSRWADEAFALLDQSVVIANPEAAGIDYHVFMKKLAELLTDGEEMKKFVKASDEKDAISQLLSRLRRLSNELLVVSACGKLRHAPFALLLSSGSSHGKSSFLDLLIAHYAHLYNKPLDPEFIYNRVPSEDHWNNFRSSMWCCVLDDIGSVNPNKGNEDPSLQDLLRIVGNISFSTPQADLPLKGKAPFTCDLVIGTTNTEHLNAHAWFSNPQAVRRRLPYIVDIVPKEQYRIPGTMMMDNFLVPEAVVGEYPNLWDITVKKVLIQPAVGNSKETVTTPVILQTSEIYEFILKYNEWLSEHRAGQTKFMATKTAVRHVNLCVMHSIPMSACGCLPLVPQGGDPPSLQVQGAGLSTLVGHALVAYGAYHASKFTAECAGEVLNANPNLVNFPGDLVANTTLRMFVRSKQAVKNKFGIWSRQAIKSILMGAIYTAYERFKPTLKKLMLGIGVLVGYGITWKLLQKELPELTEQEPQGIDDVGVMPEPKKEKENVWKKDDYCPSEFLGRLSQSWSSLDFSQAASLAAKNVVWCRTTHRETKHTVFRATCLAGHLYVAPAHVIPNVEHFMLQVIHENNSEGCNGNVQFKMARASVYFRQELELAFFEILHMPVRRNILELLPKQKGFKCDAPGRLLIRNANGQISQLESFRSSVSEEFIEQFGITTEVVASRFVQDTEGGHCGSPILVKQPNACILAGIHALGGQRNIGVAMPVTRDVVEQALEYFATPVVEAEIPFLGPQFSTTISPRCTARFFREGSLQVFGSFGGFKRQPKSTARDTLFTKRLLELGHERKFAPAPMKGYMPLHLGIKPMVEKSMTFKPDVLRVCGDHFLEKIWLGLPEEFHKELRNPLPLSVALNGFPGVKFIDSMNFSTSAGYPHNSTKRNFVMRIPADDIWQHPVVVDDTIKAEIEECWDKMQLGVSVSPVFMQHLKDEALPLHKVKAQKSRLFMGGPFAWSTCVRMALLPFVRVMQLNKYLFECAPGTNATSFEWERIYQFVTRFGEDRLIAGDFKTFDKSMGSIVIMEAFRIIRILVQRSGASKGHVNAIQVIAEDVAFAFVNFNGDLMQFYGSNPSGHPLTVIINCIVGSLYFRYCYVELNPAREIASFSTNVVVINYGDDNVLASSVDWFNHTSITQVLATVGVQYTMADKSEESIPFLPVSEISFLKRTFEYNEELDCHVAVLCEESIWKSLMIHIPSAVDSPQKQCIDTVRSAVSEWFFYGRERFEKEVSFLKLLVLDCGLEHYVEENTFLTWDELKDRFLESSSEYLRTEPISTQKILGPPNWSLWEPEGFRAPALGALQVQCGAFVSKSKFKPKADFHIPVTAFLRVHAYPKCINECGGYEIIPTRAFLEAPIQVRAGWDPKDVHYMLPYRCKEARKYPPANQNKQRSVEALQEKPLSKFYYLQPQSLELDDGDVRQTRQQNLMFSDAGMATSEGAPSISFRPDVDVSGELGNFLSRPVAINTFSWAEGNTTVLQTSFYPWTLFFSNAAIKNKITNYTRLRAKLKLKFVVNASPFYYGALRACYCPMPGNRDNSVSAGDQIKFSQMPGQFLYPQDMTSAELELPFLWPHAWLSIGTLADFNEMGRLTYYLYSSLRSANGATGQNVTVTCYAWAEDVELAGLTSGLALQADEYDTSGVISGPATAVADVAAKLTDAPVIGPFARATEIGARAVSGVASLFGYSNPPVIRDVDPYMPKAFHAFASVETGVPLDKLSIDPKNEITVDKTVAGASQDDELTVSHFCGRQSFIFGALWTDQYTPGTQLFQVPVTPRQYATNAGTSQSFINETPAAHAAAMFKFWRGEIIFTIRFVKSRYHTGRVQVSWDPQGVPGTNAETTTETRIVDLQQESEIEFSIPYKAQDPWLLTSNTGSNWAITTSGTITFDSTLHNGVLRVTVLNELTGPAASQEVDLLVFARAGRGYQMAQPNETPDWSTLAVQSLEEVDQLAPVGGEKPEISVAEVTVGETIASLRTLLHRTSYFHREFLGNAYSAANTFNLAGYYTLINYVPRFPTDYGYNAEGTNWATGIVSGTKSAFQYSPNHPMSWLGNCFVGYRGGIVHHYNVSRNGFELVDELKVERDPRTWMLYPTRQAVNRYNAGPSSAASGSSLARSPMTTASGNVRRDVIGHRGMAMTNMHTQAALSAISPYYSKWKFRPSYVATRDVVGSTDERESMKVAASMRCGSTGTTTDMGWPILTIYMAGAVDFDLIYFVCVPTYYSFSVPSSDDTY